MNVKFYKYHGTGNDFILLDNRTGQYNFLTKENIEFLCHRRFGIGADGLMFLQNKEGFDFEMVYFNSDGNESTMCGNGGRCIIQFAKDLAIIEDSCHFWAIDGEHNGAIDEAKIVSLQMINVNEINAIENAFVLNTGSPHYVLFEEKINAINVAEAGAKIRYSNVFKEKGINVNFVEKVNEQKIKVRTYERGVEDETLSCGTGVVAATIAFTVKENKIISPLAIEVLGGNLEVSFIKNENNFSNIWLKGPAVKVFEGEIKIEK